MTDDASQPEKGKASVTDLKTYIRNRNKRLAECESRSSYVSDIAMVNDEFIELTVNDPDGVMHIVTLERFPESRTWQAATYTLEEYIAHVLE